MRCLGAVFCRALASFGADVVIVDLGDADPDGAASGLSRDHGARAQGIACDVTSADQVAAAVIRAERVCGGIDVLVNNAATKPLMCASFLKWPRTSISRPGAK